MNEICTAIGHKNGTFEGYEKGTAQEMVMGAGEFGPTFHELTVWSWLQCLRCGRKGSEPRISGTSQEKMNPSLPEFPDGWRVEP